MKNKFLVLFLPVFYILLINLPALAQNLITPGNLPRDKSEDIKPAKSEKEQNKFYQSEVKIESLLAANAFDPSASFINFDDIIISDNNSIVIPSNRYAGVSFYSPYYNNNTYLTRFFSYSQPNSLIVGYYVYNSRGNYYDIYSVDTTVIEFNQPARDVSFFWGQQGYYNSGQIQIYTDNNQFVSTVQVGFNGYPWISISLSPYSQRIKKLILTRPPVSNSLYGHIFIDNFQFTPITTQSPIGYLDSVQIGQAASAVGWSVDPDNQSASNNVDCYVDGNVIGRVLANNASPDVPYPGNHRFSMPIPLQYRDGNQHQISCYGLDVTGGDAPTLLTGSPKTFKFNATIGNFDSVSANGEAIGWSLDPDVAAQSNTVHFYIDGPTGSGFFAGETIANLPRPDVNQVTGHPGNHGFSFSIPAQYRDNNNHTIYAYGIDLTGDVNQVLLGSPKTFNSSVAVQSVAFEQITNETIGNELTSSEIDRPAYGFPSQRIFAEAKFPGDTVNHKRVRVRARVGRPNVMVYFRNYDVDDPSDDPIIDDTGSTGNDNHTGRFVGGAYPPFARGTWNSGEPCSPGLNPICVKSLTNAGGDAIVYFTVTDSPGDNFRVAASTDSQYLEGVQIAGTGLADANNVSLANTVKAKQTDLLTVWRKVHLEVDSMGEVLGNALNGSLPRGTYVDVGSQPVWLTLSSNGARLRQGRYYGIQRPDGTWLYGGRLSIGFGAMSLQVLENTSAAVLVKSESGIVQLRGLEQYSLFDDDDYNSDDPLVNGDDREDIDSRYNYTMGYCLEGNETLSRLCPTSDVERNPYAAAYIEPDYEWARNQPGMNDTDVLTRIEVYHSPTDGNFNSEKEIINEKRDSDGMEINDFWIGYLLLGYQPSVSNVDSFDDDALVGVAPPAIDHLNNPWGNRASSFNDVRPGSIGAIIYLETMRDADITVGDAISRIRTAPHELGHQFGLLGDNSENPIDWGIMNYANSLYFVPHHIKVLRFRTSSPGK